MGNEWITINKDVFDIGRYESLNVFRVFLYFLTHAAQKPRFDRGVRLECGQVIVTMDEVCEATGLTAREYRTAISKLIKDKQTTNERQTIDKRTTNKFSIITICNFDSYILMEKGERQTNDKRTTNERQTIDKQPTSPPNPPKNPPFIQKEKENEKENLSPTPPIKEKDKEKEKASPQPSLKEEIDPQKISSIFFEGRKEESAVFVSEPDGSSTKQKVEKSIEQKRRLLEVHRREFYDSLIPYVQEYGKEMVRDFFDYWSEPNKGRTQMRYEMQPTWSLAMRLATWNKRKKNYVRKSATDEKREANTAVIERLREDALRRLRPMDEEESLPI
jgi:hypothetical protein